MYNNAMYTDNYVSVERAWMIYMVIGSPYNIVSLMTSFIHGITARSLAVGSLQSSRTEQTSAYSCS